MCLPLSYNFIRNEVVVFVSVQHFRCTSIFLSKPIENQSFQKSHLIASKELH